MKHNITSFPRYIVDAIKWIFSFIARHKYLATIAVFAVIVVFLDSNSLMKKQELRDQNKVLREEIKAMEEACHRDSVRLEELKNDSNEIIRVARELYFMKRSNEDVYIIKE